MFLEVFIKWLGRSLPEALCMLIFSQVLLKLTIDKKNTILYSMLLSGLAIILPIMTPIKSGPVIVAIANIGCFMYLTKVKSVNYRDAVKAIVACFGLLFLSDMISAAVIIGILKIPQELVLEGSVKTTLLSTIGLLGAFMPFILLINRKNKKDLSDN